MSRIRSSRPDSESGKVKKFEICLTGFLLIFFWVGRLNSDNVTLVLFWEFVLAIKFTRINKYKLNYKGPKMNHWENAPHFIVTIFCLIFHQNCNISIFIHQDHFVQCYRSLLGRHGAVIVI